MIHQAPTYHPSRLGKPRLASPSRGLVHMPGLQRKMAIGQDGSPFEQEADTAAQAIVDGRSARTAQFLSSHAPRGLAVPSHQAALIQQTTSAHGVPLDTKTRAFMETGFQRDFSGVRIHADANAAKSTRSLHAHAYTLGSHIVFGSGQFQPTTTAGRRLLAHELAHVAQQAANQPTQILREVDPQDPDKDVSLGALDNEYVGKAAEQVAGPGHWHILREFLRGLWGGLQAAPPDQLQRINAKFESLNAVNALKYVGGYVVGIAEGLWDSVKGLVEAAWTLLTLPYHLNKFLVDNVPSLVTRFGPRIAQLIEARDTLAPRMRKVIEGLIKQPDKAVRQLSALIDAVSGLAMAKVRQLGHGLAAQVMSVLEQPWFDYGRTIGKLVGQILFEVILAVASDAIGNIVKESLAIIGRISARVVTGAVELLRSAGRLAGEGIEWIGRLARGVSGELSELFEGMRAMLTRLKALLTELAEEGSLTETGHKLPVPNAQATVAESRAVQMPPRTSPATVSDLTPPKVHPSNVASGKTAAAPKKPSAFTSQDIAEHLDEVSEGTHGQKAIRPDAPVDTPDPAYPKNTVDPARKAEGNQARKSLRENTPQAAMKKWQKHHIVPWELREHPAVYEYERLIAKVDNPRETAAIGKRWINSGDNGLSMPSASTAQDATGWTVHKGSHPRYTSWMEGRLDQLWAERARLSTEEFGRRFESLIGEAENKLRTNFFGPKLR